MLFRLRRVLGLLAAVVLGFFLASGFVGELALDVYHMISLALIGYRMNAGGGGTIWILAAGFLIGQGIVLAVRRSFLSLAPKAAQWAEDAVVWDSALLLPTRFGLERYLEVCLQWAQSESPESSQSIALFKISGLGDLNESQGTRVATELLQDIAADFRVAALPPGASNISNFFARHMPKRFSSKFAKVPPVRCAARWSGSTFALGFRGTDMNHGLTTTREIANSLRADLASLVSGAPLQLRVVFASAPAGTTLRSLLRGAAEAMGSADLHKVTIALDPKDGRAPVLANVPDSHLLSVSMPKTESAASSDEQSEGQGTKLGVWVRSWAPPIVCFAAVPVIMALGAGKSSEAKLPWPSGVRVVPTFGPDGVTEVGLVRDALSEESVSNWKLSDGEVTQGAIGDVRVNHVEIRLTVKNLSDTTRYVSLYDFAALDASGAEIPFSPQAVLRYAEPLSGRWLAPGETLSGWLSLSRRDSPIAGIIFSPRGGFRAVMRVVERPPALRPGSSETKDSN